MSEPYTFSYTVPFHIAPTLRRLVEQRRFMGKNIDLWMGKGLLRKPFTLKGDEAEVDWIVNYFANYGEDLK